MAKINKPLELGLFEKYCKGNGIDPEAQWAEEIWPVWEARAKIDTEVLKTVSKFEQRVGDTMALDQEIITKLDTWLHQKEVSDAVKDLPSPLAYAAGELLGLVLKRRDQSSHSHGLRRPVI